MPIVLLVFSAVMSMLEVSEVGVLDTSLTVLDRVLLAFIFVELIDRVRVREHVILIAEPFLLVGLIAVVRRILLVTAEFERASAKAFPLIRVHRIEMSVPLDTSSKRDRSPGLIENLMDHGEEQAAHFLETSRKLSALERAWEGKDVEAMMGLFSEDATIGFAMSPTRLPKRCATGESSRYGIR